VLVLYWDNKDFPGNILFDQAFQTVLKQRLGPPVEYYTEYLEPIRFPGEFQALVLRGYLRDKYAGRNIDAVVAVGDPPLDFLPVPMLSPHPHRFQRREGAHGNELAGPALPDISWHTEKLDLAAVTPDTERVFIISGTIEHDKRFEIQAREELRGYEERVQLDYVTDLPLNELIEKTNSLPRHSIVLYAWQQALNEEGKVLESRDTLARISSSASVPFYGMGTANVGYGLVGGYVGGPDSNGARLAEIALRIMDGEHAQDIPVEAAPSGPEFDWRQLRRWGISEKDLPTGSAILFREHSFLELYRWQVTGVVALVILEALLIAVLLANRARRMKAEKEGARLARLAEREYRRREEVVSNVPGMVWEARAEPGSPTRKIEFMSNYAEKMLGYGLEEWSSNPEFGSSILIEEDRERVISKTEEVLRSGTESAIQFRWLAKDGRVLWAEAHLAPILDETGHTLGLRGVTLIS
jgi:PAS domain S-box-containing protein